jgi:hypothetical protein
MDAGTFIQHNVAIYRSDAIFSLYASLLYKE